MERAAKQAFDALPAGEAPPSLPARLFDALHAMASGRIATDASAELATVIVHTTPALNRAWLSDGTAVAPSALGRFLDECRLRLAVDDEFGDVMRFSDTMRTVTGPLRTLILGRDGGCCTVPGCQTTWNLHVHHIVHVEDCGKTIPTNLTTLCWHHHREHHEGRLPIIGLAPRAVGYYKPDGSQRLEPGQSGWHAPAWIDVNQHDEERRCGRPSADEMWDPIEADADADLVTAIRARALAGVTGEISSVPGPDEEPIATEGDAAAPQSTDIASLRAAVLDAISAEVWAEAATGFGDPDLANE